jgi:hypothetical protein
MDAFDSWLQDRMPDEVNIGRVEVTAHNLLKLVATVRVYMPRATAELVRDALYLYEIQPGDRATYSEAARVLIRERRLKAAAARVPSGHGSIRPNPPPGARSSRSTTRKR